MTRLAEITNATKANLIAVINTGLALLITFGVNVSDAQSAAIVGFVNSALILWVSFTYALSAKRDPLA